MILRSSNALWLVSALPVWYFSAIANPFRAGILSFIPFVGTLGLVAGGVIGVVQRARALLLFFFPFAVSECYVAIAGSLRGQLRGNESLAPSCIFILVQLALIGYFVYRGRRARLAALALSLFSASYALFALFVGGLAFADDWL